MGQKRKHQNFHPKPGHNKQTSDINRLIEEGLQQQREKAVKDKAEADQAPVSEAPQIIITREESSIRPHKLGNIVSYFLKNQQNRFPCREWFVLRNNLPLLSSTITTTRSDSNIVDILSHCQHGLAVIYDNRILFVDHEFFSTTVSCGSGYPTNLVAWSENSHESKAAVVYQNHAQEYGLHLLKVRTAARAFASISIAGTRGVHWSQLKCLEWDALSDSLLFVEDRAILRLPLDHSSANDGETLRVWNASEKTMSLTAFAPLRHSPSQYLLGTRNGSILHIDTRVREISASNNLIVGRMTYCVDQVMGLAESECHCLVRDICGAITLFDLRRSGRQLRGGGGGVVSLYPANPSKISQSRMWVSRDERLVVTHDGTSSLHTLSTLDGQEVTAPTNLLLSHDTDAQYDRDQNSVCKRVLFAKQVAGIATDTFYGTFTTMTTPASHSHHTFTHSHAPPSPSFLTNKKHYLFAQGSQANIIIL